MTTIVIKSKSEADLLTRLLKKMNIDIQLVEEPAADYETRKAMDDVNHRKGTKVKNAKQLFSKLGI